MTPAKLLQKYNTSVPRYTSYPTVPFWEGNIAAGDWKRDFQRNFHQKNALEGISLYLHLPFCESLCTYCGCNKTISNNHKVEEEYLAILLKEWNLYQQLMGETPVIRELHLGGGTPTFFSPQTLKKLLEGIFKTAVIHPKHEFGVEGHPNNTTSQHLEMLYQFGFRRVSYGVQDNDPRVQRAINRIQPIENVQCVTEQAREIGFTSVNFDLIYGLPFQTLKGEENTIRETIRIRPDRIAFYNYAHVPWKHKVQRLFDENDLPSPEMKMQLYLLAREMFGIAGYVDIGMDHFALKGDNLYKAWQESSLHRNFMGYSTSHISFLLGLGVSAISDTGTAYGQNHKELTSYYRQIDKGELAVNKGYFLDETDRAFKQYILQVTCKGIVIFRPEHQRLLEQFTIPRLQDMAKDGLILLYKSGFQISRQGLQFMRNICQAFDLKWLLSENKSSERVFSKCV